jgi:hypothetical protein
MLRIIERYEDDGTRVECGFYDDAGPLMARACAVAAAAIGAGLWLACHLPRPSTIAADPEFVQADAADRQRDREFYERRVTGCARSPTRARTANEPR